MIYAVVGYVFVLGLLVAYAVYWVSHGIGVAVGKATRWLSR